ncbi:MAG: hypothetical protein JST67_04935 [Bacteroidetes bacterium]|nr:hypothetical protein [Bacteroidota bacterium]
MKKQLVLFFTFLLIGISDQAQYRFLQGIGIFVGETSSRNKYVNGYPQDYQHDPLFLHTMPPSHNSAELQGFSVGIMLEMLRSANWRWVSEIDFCNKGAVENELLQPALANIRRPGVNHYANLQWNNYIKRWIYWKKKPRPYIMGGVRLEYNLITSAGAYSYVSGAVRKIQVSFDLGAGMEFHIKGPWNFFVEEHFNPDVIPIYAQDKVAMWNRTWETRIGIMYRFKSGIGAVDLDCHAPRYHGR